MVSSYQALKIMNVYERLKTSVRNAARASFDSQLANKFCKDEKNASENNECSE